jgi:hypothetical protein
MASSSSAPHEQHMLHVGGQEGLRACLISLDDHAPERAAVVEAKVWIVAARPSPPPAQVET